MKKADSAVLRGFASYSRFDDFASALVYTDKQTPDHIFEAVSVIQCNNVPVKLILEKIIKKHSNITKTQSDKRDWTASSPRLPSILLMTFIYNLFYVFRV
jgi:hypothetical protein